MDTRYKLMNTIYSPLYKKIHDNYGYTTNKVYEIIVSDADDLFYNQMIVPSLEEFHYDCLSNY